MNIHNILPKLEVSFYYPIGNTPPVCLTQDLPPEQDAHILLLGCGDVRNVLFTSFADNVRKIDVTCCDIEPMIHARNVLLYTLLIDDKTNHSIDKIWNIYYQWKIDGKSLELLESQSQKLLEVSESVEQWHSSVYGSTIRFCDERSLSYVRSYWSGFTSQGLNPDQMKDRLSGLEAAINRAKTNRKERRKGPDMTGYRSTFPIGLSKSVADFEECLRKVTAQWWDCGVVPAFNSLTQKCDHLNPAFLYSPNGTLTIHYGISPLGGIPLSTAYTSIKQGSAFCMQKKGTHAEYLISCAKNHFSQWAVAFRKAVEIGTVIRIFLGDAFALCFTLRNCQLTKSTTMNLFCDNWTSRALILHDSDYGHDNSAPLSFDIVDTSNLCDYLGPVNLIAVASTLLKHHTSSCFYMEMLMLWDFSVLDRLPDLFGVDVRTISLLLGLVPPDLFTKAINTVEEYPGMCNFSDKGPNAVSQISARSRLRWRLSGPNNSSHLHMEANELAKLLIQVYYTMFKPNDPKKSESELYKQNVRTYNCTSFAFLLSILKANIISDWDVCLKELYDRILLNESPEFFKLNFNKDLLLNLHIFGVDSSHFIKPNATDLNCAKLVSIFPKWKDLPDQLCVTIRIPRADLKKVFERFTPLCLYMICSFEAKCAGGNWEMESFSTVQIAFGKLCKQTEEDDSLWYIDEDDAQMSGTSDMFASVIVPTSMLTSMILKSRKHVPVVKCGLKFSNLNVLNFGLKLGLEFCFYSSKLTGKNVFITRFMPGMPGLPKINIVNNEQNNTTTDETIVHLSPDGSKISTLAKRIFIESKTMQTELAMESSAMGVQFESPLTAVVSTGRFYNRIEFPVPVSLSKYKLTVESSYIKVESPLFDPLEEDGPSFLFPCFLITVPHGVVPLSWTSMRVNLDVMPPLDLKNEQELSWLHEYAMQMFSVREFHILSSKKGNDCRTSLKEGLTFFFTKYDGQKPKAFGLQRDGSLHTLILPSCLRLDLANNTVVFDCALILLTLDNVKNPLLIQFLQELHRDGVFHIKIGEAENLAWKAMLPALTERCRTWKHTYWCEYIQAGKVPLSTGLDDDSRSPICSCGIGKFPLDYLEDKMGMYSNFNYVLNRYATRVAISPIFAIQYIEDCDTEMLRTGACGACGSKERKSAGENQQGLLVCSRCRKINYCSAECQKFHWKNGHKLYCKTMKKG